VKFLLTIQVLIFLTSVWLAIKLLALRRRLFSPAAAQEQDAVSRAGRKPVAALRRAVTVVLVAGLIYFMLMRCFVYLISQ
jgi:hypothetical protein